MLMDEMNFIINYVLEDEQLVIGFISVENEWFDKIIKSYCFDIV
jgi:hypothetical protein